MSAILNIQEKIIDKIHRFDNPIGTPLAKVDKFHTTDISNNILADNSSHDTEQMPEMEKTYEDGLSDGRSQALAELEQQHADIQKAAQYLHQSLQNICPQIEASHGRVVTQILQTVIPALTREHELSEIKDYISHLTAPALHGCVTLHAPAHLHKNVAEILQDMAVLSLQMPNIPKFKLEPRAKDVEQVGSQINAKWQGGGGTIDIGGAAEKCLSLLQNNLDNELGYKNGES